MQVRLAAADLVRRDFIGTDLGDPFLAALELAKALTAARVWLNAKWQFLKPRFCFDRLAAVTQATLREYGDRGKLQMMQ